MCAISPPNQKTLPTTLLPYFSHSLEGRDDSGSLCTRGVKSLRRGHRGLGALAVALVDVVDHQRLEVGRDSRTAECAELLAVDEDGRGRGFAGAVQGGPDIV